MTDYRKLLLELCNLADALNGEVHAAYGEMNDEADRRIDEIRSLASSPPPDLEGPTPVEVEVLALALFAAARNRWIWDSRNDVTKNEWRCAAREAWRLGARTREK